MANRLNLGSWDPSLIDDDAVNKRKSDQSFKICINYNYKRKLPERIQKD